MICTTQVFDARYPDCTLTAYIHEPFPELNIPVRRAMIVCPGGAYQGLSQREAEPPALQYFAAGMNVFVLRYSIGDAAANAAPVIQAAGAVRFVREHAEEYHIDPAYVFISGFSAGGHLSACASTLWKHPLVLRELGLSDGYICRPTASVLCYPYISEEAYARYCTIREACPGLSEGAYSMLLDWPIDRYVDGETAPSFIWHTRDDTLVPIENTLMYASALAAAGVPFEYHVYPTGIHGLSLANRESSAGHPALENPTAAAWIHDAVRYCLSFRA